MSSSDGLQVVVAINDASKTMNRHSAQVRLRALDALVRAARSTGVQLAGFREVSMQMRRWSDELSAQLNRLRKLTSESVTQESRWCTLRRRERLLAEATRQSEDAELARSLSLVRERERVILVDRRGRIDATTLLLEDLSQLGLMAMVLSHTARIEAASASDADREPLTHVAVEFGEHADAVQQLVKTLIPMVSQARREAA